MGGRSGCFLFAWKHDSRVVCRSGIITCLAREEIWIEVGAFDGDGIRDKRPPRSVVASHGVVDLAAQLLRCILVSYPGFSPFSKPTTVSVSVFLTF